MSKLFKTFKCGNLLYHVSHSNVLIHHCLQMPVFRKLLMHPEIKSHQNLPFKRSANVNI